LRSRLFCADVVKLKVSGLGARPPFVALVHKHSLGGATYDQVDSETGAAGRMLHMRRGDVLSVRLTAPPDATSADLRAIERVGGTLSIELCMRKRKRVDDLAEEGESSAASVLTCAALAKAPHDTASKASRRRERKRRTAGPPAPAVPTPGSSPAASTTALPREPEHDEARACSESDHTGSDTEWSEGFSSDDEERRKTRQPKRMRRLARGIREVQVASSADDNSTSDGEANAFSTTDDHVSAARDDEEGTAECAASAGRENDDIASARDPVAVSSTTEI
jgi:hypothetical protein